MTQQNAIDKAIEEIEQYKSICAEEYKFPFKLCIGILERIKKQYEQENLTGRKFTQDLVPKN